MTHTVEKTWTTEAGLSAAALRIDWSGHVCGYVEIPKGHPCHGKDYSATVPELAAAHKALMHSESAVQMAEQAPMLLFCIDPDNPTPVGAFEVHGGLTYAGERYWGSERGGWWFGFDTAHYNDGPAEQTVEYVSDQCEKLAKQIASTAL